ncbi:LysM peptidoglycan-binding domain-containing M23 family metallopeptidase [Paenibacillus xerothermodurans]|uniref:LysM peptidoglycan-binding domain-containing M23 family metallopeptidase n=1 Tax=Paenibacillus xerothermodurans TaxID=1977292 RepID=UPI00140314EB|nr:M23 family metallopeptidase [Paenibacillus xerothermodurans]
MDYTTSWMKEKRWIISCGSLAVLALIFSFVYMYMLHHTVTRYRVVAGTEAIGAVSNPDVVWQWLERKKTEVALAHPSVQAEVKLPDLQFVREREYEAWYDDAQAIAALNKRARIQMNGVQIRIEGKPIGFVRDEAAAVALLDQVKQKYMGGAANGNSSILARTAEGTVQAPNAAAAQQHQQPPAADSGPVIESAEFVQQVEFATMEVTPSDISDTGTLFNTIETGHVQPVKYTVQAGDCISCIAYKFQISRQAIYDNNPSVKNNIIRAGDELDLTVRQPLLSVKTREKHTVTVEVPYEITYIDDPTLRAGVKETKIPGANGLKEVTYVTTRINGEFQEQSAANETLLRPMTAAVMRKGTKVIPGVGTGTFAWPVYRAKLTSVYGKRWGGFHPGTDMVSDHTAIMAADHGKAAYAGWKKGYGNCIIIDHQNGYSTLYGHLSKILISKGDAVEKGDKIGVMGTTGNSTGVHLHFEVRKGDEQQNPLKFLTDSQ